MHAPPASTCCLSSLPASLPLSDVILTTHTGTHYSSPRSTSENGSPLLCSPLSTPWSLRSACQKVPTQHAARHEKGGTSNRNQKAGCCAVVSKIHARCPLFCSRSLSYWTAAADPTRAEYLPKRYSVIRCVCPRTAVLLVHRFCRAALPSWTAAEYAECGVRSACRAWKLGWSWNLGGVSS